MNQLEFEAALQLYHIVRTIRDLLATVDGTLADLEAELTAIIHAGHK